MDRYIFEFINWVSQNFGTSGLLVIPLGIIVLLGAVFFVLNKLPESKHKIIWSTCTTCKYKFSEKDTLVLTCPHYKKETLFLLKKSVCACSIPASDKIKGVGNCALIERADSPNYTVTTSTNLKHPEAARLYTSLLIAGHHTHME